MADEKAEEGKMTPKEEEELAVRLAPKMRQ